MPKSPAKKAEIIETLAGSPRTRQILEKKNILQTRDDQKKNDAVKSLVEDLTEGLFKNQECQNGR